MRKGGGDLNIRLYFDPKSFRHTATTYKLTMAAPTGRTTDDLELPTHWTVRLTLETGHGNFLGKWDMTFQQIAHNPSIDPQIFVLH